MISGRKLGLGQKKTSSEEEVFKKDGLEINLAQAGCLRKIYHQIFS